MERLCPVCNSPVKTVLAGISRKTGKPYDTFQVCSNNECNWKPPKQVKAPTTSSNPQLDRIIVLLEELVENMKKEENF